MMDELSRWYENLNYQEAKDILREKLENMKMNFIAAGYYMKYIRDNELFREDGYESIWEFAEDNYGIKKSTASRWMAMNDKFSQGGNSPILADEYRGFEKSQLQEMLYLDDKQIETVTTDMTVKEIREVRKPKEPEKEKKVSPIDRGCITGKNPNGNCTCCGKDGVECCGQCEDDCNSRCGWIDSVVATSQQQEEVGEYIPGKCMHNPELACSLSEEAMRTPGTGEGNCGEVCCWECPKEDCMLRCNASEKRESRKETVATSQQDESAVDMNPPEEEADPEPEVITEENIEVVDAGGKELTEELYEEASDQSDIDLLNEELDKAKNNLDLMLSCYTDKDIRVRKQKLLVGALAGMICDLDKSDIPKPEQPELPIFRNNDQRKKWLRDYKSWGLWYEDENIGVRYYKYDFDNGARLIAEVYEHEEVDFRWKPELETCYLHLIGGPEPSRNGAIPKWTRHEKYCKHPSNETELVEFLKCVQKEGK